MEKRDYKSLDDDALMAQYGQGDGRAFEELYTRHEGAVYGLCLGLLSDSDSADDAFQDTFSRIITGRDRYVPRGRFRQWLMTVARRVCLDILRKRKRHVHLPVEWAEGMGPDHDPRARVSLQQQITRLLSQLPEEQREVVVLHRYQGFSYADIAEMTDSSEAGVKQKAYRGLKRLKEIVQEMDS